MIKRTFAHLQTLNGKHKTIEIYLSIHTYIYVCFIRHVVFWQTHTTRRTKNETSKKKKNKIFREISTYIHMCIWES